MKNAIFFVMASFFFATAAFAQGGGHVGQHQRDSQAAKHFVIRGDQAALIYNRLKESQGGYRPEKSLDDVCTWPVKSVSGDFGETSYECFDRGDDFDPAYSRYKCYGTVAYADGHTFFRDFKEAWFYGFHNSCGGDGVRQKRASSKQQ